MSVPGNSINSENKQFRKIHLSNVGEKKRRVTLQCFIQVEIQRNE